MWEFSGDGTLTENNNRQLKDRVTARAECRECDSVFDIDLKLDDESMFRDINIKTVSPPQGTAWGSAPDVSMKPDILYVWGNMNDGTGSQYIEQYYLQNVTPIEDNS
jgi:hypothetical protein